MWPTVLLPGPRGLPAATPRHAGRGAGWDRPSRGGREGWRSPAAMGLGAAGVLKLCSLQPRFWARGSTSPAPATAAPGYLAWRRLVVPAWNGAGGRELPADELGRVTVPWVGGAGASPAGPCGLAMTPITRLELPQWGRHGAEGRAGHVPSSALFCSVSPPWGIGRPQSAASWWPWPVPEGCAQASTGQPMGLGSLSQSSHCFLELSGWELLRTGPPGRWRPPLDLTLFQGPPPVPWQGTRGCGGAPGSLTSPLHMWQFLFCRCSRVCSNVAPRCSHEPCRR